MQPNNQTPVPTVPPRSNQPITAAASLPKKKFNWWLAVLKSEIGILVLSFAFTIRHHSHNFLAIFTGMQWVLVGMFLPVYLINIRYRNRPPKEGVKQKHRFGTGLKLGIGVYLILIIAFAVVWIMSIYPSLVK